MRNAIAAELMKLRRSRALPLLLIVCLAPPAVKLLRALLAPAAGGVSWQSFLASGQELTVFSLLIAVLLSANHVFTQEYRFRTAAAVFTVQTGRTAIFTAKIITLFLMIPAMFLLSALAQLLCGAAAVPGALPRELLGTFLLVQLWYAAAFSLLAVAAGLVAVLVKRFTPAAVITLGYYILLFPFHTKTLYVCFFMTPVVIAARLFGSADYIFAFDYRDITAGLPQAAVFLLALGAASFAAGLCIYRRADA